MSTIITNTDTINAVTWAYNQNHWNSYEQAAANAFINGNKYFGLYYYDSGFPGYAIRFQTGISDLESYPSWVNSWHIQVFIPAGTAWYSSSTSTISGGTIKTGQNFYLAVYFPGRINAIAISTQTTSVTYWIRISDLPKAQFTITFNPNGGNISQSSITQSFASSITLPTPTRDGYEFLGWKGDLMDIISLTTGDINSTTGEPSTSTAYVSTKELIPFIPNAIINSNYQVCAIYTYRSNGTFIKRISSYDVVHNISSADTAFIRVEVALSYVPEDYQNSLKLIYTLPANSSFRIGYDQTLTAQWKAKNLVNIYNGTEWKQAVPYVFNGTDWQEAQAQVFDGTDWKIVSG